MCIERGSICDHVIPLSEGGLDTDSTVPPHASRVIDARAASKNTAPERIGSQSLPE